MVTIETELGTVAVKLKLLDGKAISAAPEPDAVRRIAMETGRAFQDVYRKTEEEARRQLI